MLFNCRINMGCEGLRHRNDFLSYVINWRGAVYMSERLEVLSECRKIAF